jgi:HAD superfamily hydrolase (TIGR01509 family)
MGRPEVVIFDLGKVLVDFDYSRCAQKLALNARLSAPELQKLIDHSPLLCQYETGQIDKTRFYREVCALTGYCGKQHEFEPAFADIFTPIEPMIAAQQHLRARNIPTFILSNTNDLAVGHIRRTFPFFSGFDGYVFSFEHGAMKPQERIYEVAEKATGRSGPRILYIDDRLENLEPAKRRSWQVIHQIAPESTIRLLKEQGLL